MAVRASVDTRLSDYLDKLAKGLSPRDARMHCGVTDKLLSSWLEDATTRKRIEAAERGVAAPEVKDGDSDGASSHAFPWEKYRTDPIGRLRAIDQVLSASGFHAMSSWWDWTFASFYASGKFQLTARVGRRGGKSSDVSRVAVSEAIGSPRTLPPGESGVWPIISHTMPEAHDRLDTIEAILKALAFRQVDKKPEEFGTYQRTTELGRKLIRSLDVNRNIIEWTVFPASINGVSGFTAIGAMCDEGAKWRDDKTGANPASIVLGSLRPCFATQPDAHLFFISSAFSTIDAHHDAIEEGDTDMQFLARLGAHGVANDVEQRERAASTFEARAAAERDAGKPADAKAFADKAKAIRESVKTIDALSPNVPTWSTNPSLDIERTLSLESDFATWLREYASVPTGSGAAYFFDHATIDRCLLVVLVPRVPTRVTVGIDPGLESNAFGACAWGLDADGAWLVDALELLPSPGAPLDDDESFATCAEFALTHKARTFATDGHYIATARRHAAKNGLTLVRAPNENGPVFLDFRREAGRGRIRIGGHALSSRIARQLKCVRGQPMSGGKYRITLEHEAGGTHGDVASAAVRGWWALTRASQTAPLWMPVATRPGRRVV